MENWEDNFEKMSKPEMPELLHGQALKNAIERAEEKSVISFWWLLVAVYVIGAFLLKTLYKPGSFFLSSIRAFKGSQVFPAILFFLISPAVVLLFSVRSIKERYFLAGNPRLGSFVRSILVQVFLIFFSLITIVIYFL